MSVNTLIMTALSPFGHPVCFEVYAGTEKTYYVFNDESLGDDYADDAPNHERDLVQVHFYCPLNVNVTTQVLKTKQALFAAGFTWPTTVNASDEYTRHVVFECEYAEGVDLGD